VRKALPDNLPREVIEIDLAAEEKACPCCGGARHVIGEEVSEKLDIVPARMTVLEYRRKKYACRACEGEMATAPMPAQIIEQGMATPGLIAHIAIAKFCDHQPLARQEKFFARHDIRIPRSTQTDWMLSAGVAVSPLVERMGELLKTSDYLANDDTPLPWQNGRQGKTATARLWAWRGLVEDKPLLVYHFTADRSGEHPADFLKDWRGYLQVDAYSAYDRLFADGKIIEVGCMAHARRRYFEIAKAAKTPGFAHEIVERIGALYAIEREAKEMKLAAAERKALRQERAPPILAAIKTRLDEHLSKLPPKGTLAKAIAYTLNHWAALTRYLDDGRLEIDNNATERAMRPVALGRHNWLFIASERGGHATAALYSLIESAKANGLNPYVYLRDVLTRLPTTKAKDIDLLLPHRWKPNA
jgi:transposase